MLGFDFKLDSMGIILGWTYQNGMFYDFEYFDNFIKSEPNLKQIEISGKNWNIFSA